MGASEALSLDPKPSKTYRRPRRRPAHLRTKTGCLTCRRRKKKCDETRLQCLNCKKQNMNCVWKLSESQLEVSVPKNQKFASVNEVTKGALDQVPFSSTPASSPKQAAKAPGASRVWSENSRHKKDLISLSAPSNNEYLSWKSVPPWTYSSAITPESRHLFHFLKWKFLPELIRPAADSRVIDVLSKHTLALALQQPFCMHALLACCGAEIPTHDPTVRELARFHYTHAVAALRRNLNDGNIQTQWVVTMLTVMMLCIYERSQVHRSSGVEVHLAGAARLIRLCSQNYSRDLEPSGIQQSMHRLVRESFIFHVATSLPFQDDHMHQMEIEAAFRQAEEAIYPHFLSDDSFHSDSPVLGFPPKLFRCIYMVWRLYQTSQWSSVDLQTCQDLGQDLIQWDHHITTSTVDNLLDHQTEAMSPNGSIDLTISKFKRPFHPAPLGPALYILGCRILLRRMSSVCARSEPDLERLLQEGIAAVQQLQPKQDYFAEYYCWPLLIIGMHLEHQPDRDLLMSQVHAFWVATNNGTMRQLADKLLGLWNVETDSSR
ncbi:hypothetical protein N7513_009132 [Penicillium frequentans]|nr:hypothetical protein N7513_009132 [Penicillium glabrum]